MEKHKHRVVDNPWLNVVLYRPEIPANTGNIARLCGAAELRLHLIHPLGFKFDNKHLKRAGLDYWHEIDILHYENFDDFIRGMEKDANLIALSRHGNDVYTQAKIKKGDYLLFGQETKGLPSDIMNSYFSYYVPIWGKVRSLNLSTTVGIVAYHYLNHLDKF
ncbi:tRNA (cytidine(34)-2'-O)-methyltransferase [Thermodesulfobacteriota bacterium]